MSTHGTMEENDLPGSTAQAFAQGRLKPTATLQNKQVTPRQGGLTELDSCPEACTPPASLALKHSRRNQTAMVTYFQSGVCACPACQASCHHGAWGEGEEEPRVASDGGCKREKGRGKKERGCKAKGLKAGEVKDPIKELRAGPGGGGALQ